MQTTALAAKTCDSASHRDAAHESSWSRRCQAPGRDLSTSPSTPCPAVLLTQQVGGLKALNECQQSNCIRNSPAEQGEGKYTGYIKESLEVKLYSHSAPLWLPSAPFLGRKRQAGLRSEENSSAPACLPSKGTTAVAVCI